MAKSDFLADSKSLFETEEKVLKFWEEAKIFQKSLDKNPKDKIFSFYDGPPFITGLPHYATLLPSIAKDIIPRYQTMKGKYVRRIWGWDTHGLPAENQVEKQLGTHEAIKHWIEFCKTSKRGLVGLEGVTKLSTNESEGQYFEEWK